ncbi:MAG TPA: hypothetical protein VF669_10965 [Tepidisphaeraceae bacterium]|jgi:hypothetical protein
MSRKINWLLSSAVAVASVALIVPATARAADDNANTANTTRNDQTVGDKTDDRGTGSVAERTTGKTQFALPAGAKQDADIANSVKLSGPIAGVANQALDKNGLGDMAGYFVDQDRDRLKDIKNINADELNNKVQQIADAYKNKFNTKFDVDAQDFSAAQAVEGEIQDPAQFVQNWPLPLVSGMSDQGQSAAAHVGANSGDKNHDAHGSVNVGDTKVSGSVSANTDTNNNDNTKDGVDKDTAKNGNIEKGRNVAIVRLPAEKGMPAMDVCLIREVTAWKIDIPNNRTAQQIHDDVSRHLDMVADASKWQGDALQTRREIARHVLMGIYGVEMQPKTQAQAQ